MDDDIMLTRDLHELIQSVLGNDTYKVYPFGLHNIDVDPCYDTVVKGRYNIYSFCFYFVAREYI